MKAKVTTRVVQDVAGARSNAGGSGGGRKDGPATRSSSRQRGRSASTGSRASPARRETATSGGTGSGGGTGSARTEEMPVEGADAAGDEEQTEGRRDGVGAATASVASLETMAAALQDLTAVVASIQAGAGHRTVPGGVRRRRQRAAGGGGPPTPPSSDSEVSSDSDSEGGGGGRRVQYGDDASESSPSNATDDDAAPVAASSQARGRRSQRVTGQHAWSQRRSIKDLELPTFTPSPKASVSTWISRVDLALRGARESGLGNWSDRDLYFILGPKLLENTARWWVNQDRQLRDDQRTWTGLKKALLRRYDERLDKSTAEWRVTMRRMMPGETYADYAAALREVVGCNRVKERTLLAQFYRNLDKTTRQLVKQSPTPRTLEEAVDKASETDDQMDNVAKGMENIGQSWATAPSPFLVPMAGTTGQTMVIPGVGNPDLAGYVAGEGGPMAGSDSAWALFTNPRGVFNRWSGTWEPPTDRTWNGKYWALPKAGSERVKRKKADTSSTEAPKVKTEGRKKARVLIVQEDSGESAEEEEAEPAARKRSAGAVRQVVSERGREGKPADPASKCFLCGSSEH
ncbi:hypothetical protein PF010_g15520 [Phytophthora fragariae]|uniref:Retrotransposon gag domain-containing protein n=1 Tax=Phytophthora fragariae TaxID=53985 RepID=A0A6G0KUL2_9STRA|nr:hypothetical protein PF010_g15520 [Phytophthora fragariae]KAE9240997.1 hypothetical protein PF004_g7260 [Phytophthora fragariae]